MQGTTFLSFSSVSFGISFEHVFSYHLLYFCTALSLIIMLSSHYHHHKSKTFSQLTQCPFTGTLLLFQYHITHTSRIIFLLKQSLQNVFFYRLQKLKALILKMLKKDLDSSWPVFIKILILRIFLRIVIFLRKILRIRIFLFTKVPILRIFLRMAFILRIFLRVWNCCMHKSLILDTRIASKYRKSLLGLYSETFLEFFFELHLV